MAETLQPAQGIRVKQNKTYVFDPNYIDAQVGKSEEWATKTDGKVKESDVEIDYSSKAYAIGGTGTETNNAKYYAGQAASSASSASIDAGIASAAASDANVVAVGTDLQDANSKIKAVANNKTNIDAVAGIASDVSTVASKASEVDAVATNISDVNTAAANIQAIQDAPTQAANAAESAELSAQYANDKINQTHITNVVTDIPQDIKLSLSSGTLTLASGSKVYVPNGADTFDEITVPSDKTYSFTSEDSTRIIVYNSTSNIVQSVPEGKCFSGSTAPSGSGTILWYDTTNNLVKRSTDGGSTWSADKYSLPNGVVTVYSNSIQRIDHVFNGFGYIGSALFSLPGIKGIYPDGRNADGTLKSSSIATTKVLVLNDNAATGLFHIMLASNAIGNYVNVFYDVDRNILWNSGNPQISRVDCGVFKRLTGGIITFFNPKRVLEVEDKSNELQNDILTGMSVNLKDFGAKGNNSADDTEALQTAINYCIDNDKTLYVPAGEYRVTNIITPTLYETTLRKAIKIVGTSGSIIRVSGSLTFGKRLYVKLNDLAIEGTNTSGAAVVLGDDEYTNNGYFKGVRIQGNPVALYFKRAFDIGFEDCRFNSLATYDEPVDIQPVVVFGKGSADWTADQSTNCVTFTRCQWEHTAGNGAQVYFSGENSAIPFVVSFFGCHFESRNRNSRAFYIEAGQTIGFYNCTFTNNDYVWSTDTHTRASNYIANAEGIDIVNCMFDRYNNKMIDIDNVSFLNILATTIDAYSYVGYAQLSTFFNLGTVDTSTWKCCIHNGVSSSENYEYNHQTGKPSYKFDAITLGGSGSSYTAPADGYVTLSIYSGAANEEVRLTTRPDDNTKMIASAVFSTTFGQRLGAQVPVSKGMKVQYVYSATGSFEFFNFVYAKGEV